MSLLLSNRALLRNLAVNNNYTFEDLQNFEFEDSINFDFETGDALQVGNVVIFMSGQSNSVGLGSSGDYAATYPELLDPINAQVWNGSSFEQLDYPNNHNWPTHYSTVGAELALMYFLSQEYPNINFYLVKRAYGSEEINNWLSGGSRYDEYNSWFENALKYISLDKDNYKAFFVWDQGESDGDQTEAIANLYGGKLTSLIQHYRSFLNVNELPFIAREHRSDITGVPYVTNIITQQNTVVESDFYLVDSSTYQLQDGVHFSGYGQYDLATDYFNIIQTYL